MKSANLPTSLEKTAPSAYQSVFLRAASGRSRTAAIKAFCLTCVGFCREDIKGCTAPACPLFPYRPYQSDIEGDDE